VPVKNFKKFSKIKRVGHDQNQGMFEEDGELIIKEKLDGANFRFTFNEDAELVFGSKNVEYVDEEGEPAYSSEDYEKLDSRFEAAIDHVREVTDLRGQTMTRNYGSLTFFGENMVKHSLDYEWSDTPQFIGFDIYDHDEERWLSTEEAYRIFEKLGLETAPIIARMPAEEFDPEEFGAEHESQYRDGLAEGVVLINEGAEENHRSGFNTRSKMVTEEFKEKHEQATSANHGNEQPKGHQKLADKYCTDGRIKKHIHKMRDEGYELGMHLMSPENGEGLFMRVAKDIVEEEWREIAESSWTIDFKEFRNVVATRCANKLQAHMQGEAS